METINTRKNKEGESWYVYNSWTRRPHLQLVQKNKDINKIDFDCLKEWDNVQKENMWLVRASSASIGKSKIWLHLLEKENNLNVHLEKLEVN